MSDAPPPAPPTEQPPAAPAPAIEPTTASARSRRLALVDFVLIGITVVLVLGILAVTGLTILVAARNAQVQQSRIGSTIDQEDLQPGDCLAAFDSKDGYDTFPLTSCDAPHAAEYISANDLDIGTDNFLGDSAMIDLANSICQTSFDFHLHLADLSSYPSAYLVGVRPARSQADNGVATFQCFLVNKDGSPLVGQYYTKDVLN